MKKLLAILLSVLVMGLLAMFVRGGCEAPAANAPYDITLAAIQSLEAGDINETCSYFTGSSYNQMREGLQTFFIYNDIKVSDVVVDVLEETDSIARVYIEYDLQFASMGYTDTQRITKTVRCIKSNGQWYLSTTL